MKSFNCLCLLFVLLSGCGQPGPLYLPSDKPPIYVEPEEKSESTEQKSPAITSSDQPVKQ